MTHADSPPVVLAISGNDPSGGAGIQADIEALASMGAHCAPVITTLTVQDTRNAWRIETLDPGLVVEQAEAVLADLEVRVIKIGLLGSVAVAQEIAVLLKRHPELPVVLDPVLIAGGGAQLAEATITEVMRKALMPLATVVTPNSDEARALAPLAATLEDAAMELVALGAEYVLLKGAHEATDAVSNRLFGSEGLVEHWTWPRLNASFHGSGCTLASALAGRLARGDDMRAAATRAQDYVQAALTAAHRIGRGQPIPARFHWAPNR